MRAKTIPEEKVKQIIFNASTMGEKQKRQYLASEAELIGYGGAALISRVTGVALETIRRGLHEIRSGDVYSPSGPHREEGGGRKGIMDSYPGMAGLIEKIVDAHTYGSPMGILRWTSLSLREISRILQDEHGIKVSHSTVGEVLGQLGYSRQANRKMEQVGKAAPDRNEQFEYIDRKSKEFIEEGQPVISVDTKKKENLGEFKNAGTEYRRKGDPRRVLDHDFPIAELGKVSPYGIYVLNNNTAFVNLGTDHDTGQFAMESIYRWWYYVGQYTFPDAEKIYITCDSGGSNAVNARLWKDQLAEFAFRTGLEVHVSHYPAGTSKYNKIEHRLFCYISKTWQGQPLVDVETVVRLVGSTTTSTGLVVKCMADYNKYATGIKITDEAFSEISIEYLNDLGRRNYVIYPN